MAISAIVLAALGIIIVFYLYFYFGAPSPKVVLADLLKNRLKPVPLAAGEKPPVIEGVPALLLGNNVVKVIYLRRKIGCNCQAEVAVFFYGKIHKVNMTFVDGRLLVWAKNGIKRKIRRDEESCLYKALYLVREAVK